MLWRQFGIDTIRSWVMNWCLTPLNRRTMWSGCCFLLLFCFSFKLLFYALFVYVFLFHSLFEVYLCFCFCFSYWPIFFLPGIGRRLFFCLSSTLFLCLCVSVCMYVCVCMCAPSRIFHGFIYRDTKKPHPTASTTAVTATAGHIFGSCNGKNNSK